MTNPRSILIQPRDPLIFRDGKPFGTGLPAKTLPFATPSAIVGAVRTRDAANGVFNAAVIERLLKIEQTGPFLAYRCTAKSKWKLAFAAPADVVGYSVDSPRFEGELQWAPLRPHDDWAMDCDLPDALSPLAGALAQKPAKNVPAFWTAGSMLAWLAGTLPGADPKMVGFPALPRDKRVQDRKSTRLNSSHSS